MQTSPQIARAARLLLAGKPVAFPTETVYGLGADALNPAAVAQVFTLKGRPAEHPLIVHLPLPEDPSRVAFRELLEQWASAVPDSAVELAQACWPGPLTIVLARSAAVPDCVTGGLDTVALRVPSDSLALGLLAEFARQRGGPAGLAAPSANRFGAVSPTTAQHVLADYPGAYLLTATNGPPPGGSPEGLAVLDGGPCALGIESSIVDLTTGAPRLLRHGAVTEQDVAAVLAGRLPAAPSKSDAGPAPRVPGSLERHYSPQARVTALEAEELEELLSRLNAQPGLAEGNGLLAPARLLAGRSLPVGLAALPLGDSLTAQAQGLYAALREADELGLGNVYAVLPPPEGLGLALRDRLSRAAGVAPS